MPFKLVASWNSILLASFICTMAAADRGGPRRRPQACASGVAVAAVRVTPVPPGRTLTVVPLSWLLILVRKMSPFWCQIYPCILVNFLPVFLPSCRGRHWLWTWKCIRKSQFYPPQASKIQLPSRIPFLPQFSIAFQTPFSIPFSPKFSIPFLSPFSISFLPPFNDFPFHSSSYPIFHTIPAPIFNTKPIHF